MNILLRQAIKLVPPQYRFAAVVSVYVINYVIELKSKKQHIRTWP